MRKKTLVAIVCTLAAFRLLAQNADSLPSHTYRESLTNKYQPFSPLLVIKGEEISRFPSADFLDAVNSLFPWVFAQYPNPDDYLFLVNGCIVLDINSISLYDIEEVTFDRSQLNGSLYPFSKAGIFSIKTKRSKDRRPLINFDSRYGVSWNKENGLFRPGNTIPPSLQQISSQKNNSSGQVHSNHLSIAAGSNKFHVYASAELQGINAPKSEERGIFQDGPNSDTFQGNFRNRILNLKSFLNLSYKFSKRLSAGVTGNYFHGHANEDTAFQYNYPGNSYTRSAVNINKLVYYHAAGYISWNPIDRLQNSVSFEYAGDRDTYNSDALFQYLTASSIFDGKTETNTKIKSDQYHLRDRLSYQLFMKGKFKLVTSVAYSYLKQDLDYKSYSTTIYGNPPSASASFLIIQPVQKISSLNGSAAFSWNDIISGYAGYATIINKIAKNFSGESKSNPYAGIGFDLKKIFHASKNVNRLTFSADYGDITSDNASNYWIVSTYKMGSYIPGAHLASSYDPSANKNDLLKNKMLSLQINSSFQDDRFQVGAGWSKLVQEHLFLFYNPFFPTYIFENGKATQTGVSLFTAGKIINQSSVGWDARFNILFPDIKIRVGDNNLSQGFILTDISYTTQAGLQQHFRFDRFAVQLNALLGAGRKETNYQTGVSTKKETEVALNYLSFGYDVPMKGNSFFQDLNIFAHARNLLADKKTKEYYRIDSYAGIGINITLQ